MPSRFICISALSIPIDSFSIDFYAFLLYHIFITCCKLRISKPFTFIPSDQSGSHEWLRRSAAKAHRGRSADPEAHWTKPRPLWQGRPFFCDVLSPWLPCCNVITASTVVSICMSVMHVVCSYCLHLKRKDEDVRDSGLSSFAMQIQSWFSETQSNHSPKAYDHIKSKKIWKMQRLHDIMPHLFSIHSVPNPVLILDFEGMHSPDPIQNQTKFAVVAIQSNPSPVLISGRCLLISSRAPEPAARARLIGAGRQGLVVSTNAKFVKRPRRSNPEVAAWFKIVGAGMFFFQEGPIVDFSRWWPKIFFPRGLILVKFLCYQLETRRK